MYWFGNSSLILGLFWCVQNTMMKVLPYTIFCCELWCQYGDLPISKTNYWARSSFHGNMLSNLTWSLVNFVCSIWSSFLGIYEATMKQRSHGKKLNGLQQYLSRHFRIILSAQHKILLHLICVRNNRRDGKIKMHYKTITL